MCVHVCVHSTAASSNLPLTFIIIEFNMAGIDMVALTNEFISQLFGVSKIGIMTFAYLPSGSYDNKLLF